MVDEAKEEEGYRELTQRRATCLTPLGEDEFCSPECREAWWAEYKRSNVQLVA